MNKLIEIINSIKNTRKRKEEELFIEMRYMLNIKSNRKQVYSKRLMGFNKGRIMIIGNICKICKDLLKKLKIKKLKILKLGNLNKKEIFRKIFKDRYWIIKWFENNNNNNNKISLFRKDIKKGNKVIGINNTKEFILMLNGKTLIINIDKDRVYGLIGRINQKTHHLIRNIQEVITGIYFKYDLLLKIINNCYFVIRSIRSTNYLISNEEIRKCFGYI